MRFVAQLRARAERRGHDALRVEPQVLCDVRAHPLDPPRLGPAVAQRRRYGRKQVVAEVRDAEDVRPRLTHGEMHVVLRSAHPGELEQFHRPSPRFSPRPPQQVRYSGDVFAHRQVRHEPDLLDHVADVAAQLHRIHLVHPLAVHHHGPGGLEHGE